MGGIFRCFSWNPHSECPGFRRFGFQDSDQPREALPDNDGQWPGQRKRKWPDAWPVDSVDCCTDYTNKHCLMVCQGWLFVIWWSSDVHPVESSKMTRVWAFETAHSKGFRRSEAPLSGCNWMHVDLEMVWYALLSHWNATEKMQTWKHQKLETWKFDHSW